MSAAAAPVGATRRAMLAKVHIARKEMALDDAAYGDVLLRVTGQPSAAVLSDAQLARVLDEFKRLGWKPRPGSGVPGRLRPASQKGQVRMIYGIWGDLKPFLADPSEAALRAFVKRQTTDKVYPLGVSAPEFLDAAQCNRVIEGLKAWLARERRRAAPAPGEDA